MSAPGIERGTTHTYYLVTHITVENVITYRLPTFGSRACFIGLGLRELAIACSVLGFDLAGLSHNVGLAVTYHLSAFGLLAPGIDMYMVHTDYSVGRAVTCWLPTSGSRA